MKTFADYTAAAAAAPTNAAKREIYSQQFAYQSECEQQAAAGLALGQVVTDADGFIYTVVAIGPKTVLTTYCGNFVKAEYGYKKRFKKYQFVSDWAVQIAESLRPPAVATTVYLAACV